MREIYNVYCWVLSKLMRYLYFIYAHLLFAPLFRATRVCSARLCRQVFIYCDYYVKFLLLFTVGWDAECAKCFVRRHHRRISSHAHKAINIQQQQENKKYFFLWAITFFRSLRLRLRLHCASGGDVSASCNFIHRNLLLFFFLSGSVLFREKSCLSVLCSLYGIRWYGIPL